MCYDIHAHSFADGVDYRISMKSFTILPDEDSAIINVDVSRDDTVEEAEFVDLIISQESVIGAVLESTRISTQVQIRDSNGRFCQKIALLFLYMICIH